MEPLVFLLQPPQAQSSVPIFLAGYSVTNKSCDYQSKINFSQLTFKIKYT